MCLPDDRLRELRYSKGRPLLTKEDVLLVEEEQPLALLHAHLHTKSYHGEELSDSEVLLRNQIAKGQLTSGVQWAAEDPSGLRRVAFQENVGRVGSVRWWVAMRGRDGLVVEHDLDASAGPGKKVFQAFLAEAILATRVHDDQDEVIAHLRTLMDFELQHRIMTYFQWIWAAGVEDWDPAAAYWVDTIPPGKYRKETEAWIEQHRPRTQRERERNSKYKERLPFGIPIGGGSLEDGL